MKMDDVLEVILLVIIVVVIFIPGLILGYNMDRIEVQEYGKVQYVEIEGKTYTLIEYKE